MTFPKRFVLIAVLLSGLAGAVSAQTEGAAPSAAQDGFVPVSELPPQEQLPAAPLLVTAYAFVWVAVFGYVVSVARRLSSVQREVERLESDFKRSSGA